MPSRDSYLQKRFFDDKHFPYGFSRSGDFSLSEVKTLEQNGHLCKALTDGVVDDLTAEDQQFLQVMAGKAEAESPIEKVWLKYLKRCNRAPVWLTTRRESQQELTAADDYDDDFEDMGDDFEEAV